MSDKVRSARLLRIATALLAFLAAYFGFSSAEPALDSATLRLDEAESRLRSDDMLFADRAALEAAKGRLESRYRASLEGNVQAEFVRDLSSDADRHGVTVLSTSFAQGDAPSVSHERFGTFAPVITIQSAKPRLSSTRVTIQLRGSYRAVLAAAAELSLGSQIVRVDVPTLHRDNDAVVASIPATLIAPLPDSPTESFEQNK